MKECPNCHAATNDNERFCSSCGTALSEVSENYTAHHQQSHTNDNKNKKLDESLDFNEYALEKLIEIQEDIHFELCTIRKWIAFFGILIIIGLVVSIISIAK